MKKYEVRTVQLPGGEVYAYRRAGNGGDTVVLIHGNMSSSAHWLTALEALEDEFTVYAPDMRGFGDSSYNSEFDSLGELAQDLMEFVDALGIEECYLCGWSTGGGVAMEFAASRPEETKGLILLDSVPPTGYPMFKKDAEFKPILTEPLMTKEDVAADPVQVVPALNALKSGDRATMQYFWDLTIFNINKPSSQDCEVYLDGVMKQRNLVDIDYALLTFDIVSRLPEIKCPVTMLHGEKDMVVPLAWAQASLALFGGRAEMVTFANAGHSPITDVPDEFFAALKAALRK